MKLTQIVYYKEHEYADNKALGIFQGDTKTVQECAEIYPNTIYFEVDFLIEESPPPCFSAFSTLKCQRTNHTQPHYHWHHLIYQNNKYVVRWHQNPYQSEPSEATITYIGPAESEGSNGRTDGGWEV